MLYIDKYIDVLGLRYHAWTASDSNTANLCWQKIDIISTFIYVSVKIKHCQ